jgi:phenylpropionate dioxygenase-like ring-hydroxylating dioxygenase large terminal subunit
MAIGQRRYVPRDWSAVDRSSSVLSLVDLDRGRVHMGAYTDPEVFALEMRRIFYSTWVYLGHDSEIAQPGDYKTTALGRVPVILSRDEEGGINALVNRCAHRGTTVCQRESGNGSYFKCEYHGWVYNNKGELTGVSLRRGYADSELPGGLGLQRIPRVEAYRGLIFGSVNPDVVPLTDYLGLTVPYLDDWADQTPAGTVALRRGIWKFSYDGNWKLQAENSTEGYHPDFLHQAAIRVQTHNRNRSRPRETKARPIKIAALEGLGKDLGHGHNLVETPQVSLPLKRKFPAAFLQELTATYGADRVDRLLGPPWRLFIFPNLALAGSNVRVINPVTVSRTQIRQYYVDLPGAPPEVTDYRLAQEQGFYGPSGYGAPDDVEMFERIQAGLASADCDLLDPWVLFTRQVSDEKLTSDGELTAHSTSEIQQRAIYRAWHQLMSQEGSGRDC